MRARLAALGAASALALSVVPGPAPADPGGGVPVFHDRVVKRDRGGDVKGDRTTPIDIRRVQHDHYQLGKRGHYTLTVRFAKKVRRGSELRFATGTRPAKEYVVLTAKVGGRSSLRRDGTVVRKPRIKVEVAGRRVRVTVPWKKLGNPARLRGLSVSAVLFRPEKGWTGIDTADRPRAVLD